MLKLFQASLFVLVLTISACKDKPPTLETPSGKIINTRVVVKMADQVRGLSGTPENEFKDDEAMLFYYESAAPRRFWMPDTYFDLDIFFLDQDFRIIDIERDVKHHPGYSETPPIPTTRTIIAHHVLEMKSSSKLSKELKPGDQLKWKNKPSAKSLDPSAQAF